MPILRFVDVWKSYRVGKTGGFDALRGLSCEVEAGERVAVVGRSGSGKSTLLHLAAGIDRPTRGRVELAGRDLAELSDRERTLGRRDDVGLVFQFFHLLPGLSVLDNVLLPALIAGDRIDEARERALALLERVELVDRREQEVDRLSGGEMQRVAICRALLRQPKLLLADEPTGNLDDRTGRRVMEELLELSAGRTLIYVTHSRELAALADRRLGLQSGRAT